MKRKPKPRHRMVTARLGVSLFVAVALISCQDFFGTTDLKESIRGEVVQVRMPAEDIRFYFIEVFHIGGIAGGSEYPCTQSR